MEHKFEGIILVFLTMAIGVILVGSVILPQAFTPSTNPYTTSTNATAILRINSTVAQGWNNLTFVTTNIATDKPMYFVVSFNANGTSANATQLALAGTGASVGNFSDRTGVTNSTNVTVITIALANVNTTRSAGLSYQRYTLNTSEVGLETNLTSSAVLTYYQLTPQQSQGWDAGSTAIWVVVPLVIIASLMLMVMSGKR